ELGQGRVFERGGAQRGQLLQRAGVLLALGQALLHAAALGGVDQAGHHGQRAQRQHIENVQNGGERLGGELVAQVGGHGQGRQRRGGGPNRRGVFTPLLAP